MSRRSSSADLRAQLARCAARATPAQITGLVEALVALVECRDKPDMALGALFRHNAPPGFPPAVKQSVREEVLAILRTRARDENRAGALGAVAPDGGWLFVHEASSRLRVQERTLKERLKDWRHRRRLGWPRWDGHQWLIPAWAVDSTRAVAILAALPEREPLADLLPDWCERQP